jgi:hypothetical protein
MKGHVIFQDENQTGRSYALHARPCLQEQSVHVVRFCSAVAEMSGRGSRVENDAQLILQEDFPDKAAEG